MIGYFKDILDKLFYVRARHLRVDLARWLTVDPLWPRQPGYVYASDSPASNADPSGLLPICVIPCACAAACTIDMLAVCADWSGFSSYGDCLRKTYDELPGWLKWLCSGCIVGCIACLIKKAIILKPPSPALPKIWNCAAATAIALSYCTAPPQACYQCTAFNCTSYAQPLGNACVDSCAAAGVVYCSSLR